MQRLHSTDDAEARLSANRAIKEFSISSPEMYYFLVRIGSEKESRIVPRTLRTLSNCRELKVTRSGIFVIFVREQTEAKTDHV
jgi:hypothetical protein